MKQLTTQSSERFLTASEHLVRAAEQLRRFNALGFGAFSEPAAAAVEKFAEALRDERQED